VGNTYEVLVETADGQRPLAVGRCRVGGRRELHAFTDSEELTGYAATDA
jgi:hypothetical protein